MESESSPCDVFLSYVPSEQNKNLIACLSTLLKHKGGNLEVLQNELNLTPEDDGWDVMGDRASTAGVVVVVLSLDYVCKDLSMELLRTLISRLDDLEAHGSNPGSEFSIIPVYWGLSHDQCMNVGQLYESPMWPKNIKPVMEKSVLETWEGLVNRLTEFPGIHLDQEEYHNYAGVVASKTADVVVRKLASSGRLPQDLNRPIVTAWDRVLLGAPLDFMVGRGDEVDEALGGLLGKAGTAVFLGSSGEGKSTLAVNAGLACCAAGGCPGGAFVVDFAGFPACTGEGSASVKQYFASTLKLQLQRCKDLQLPEGSRWEDMVEWLTVSAPGTVLLVLENLEAAMEKAVQENAVSSMVQYLQQLGSHTTHRVLLILNTRKALNGKLNSAPVIELKGLSQAASEELLVRLSGKEVVWRAGHAAKLAQACKLNALSITLLAGFLRTGRCDAPKEAIQRYEATHAASVPAAAARSIVSRSLEWLRLYLRDHELESIAALSIFRGPFTAKAASVVGIQVSDHRTNPWESSNLKSSSGSGSKLATIKQLLDDMVNMSVLQKDTSTRKTSLEYRYSMHPWIRELGEELRVGFNNNNKATSAAPRCGVEDRMAWWMLLDSEGPGQKLTVYSTPGKSGEVDAVAFRELLRHEGANFRVAAQLCASLEALSWSGEQVNIARLVGRAMHTMLYSWESRVLLEKLVSASTRNLGGEHPRTLNVMGTLATVIRDLGDLEGARKLKEGMLVQCRRVLGPEHPDTLTVMNNLAITMKRQGDLSGARKLEEDVLSARRRGSGPEHPKTLLAKMKLAATLRDQGELEGAKKLQEEVLVARKKALGPDNADTLATMTSLASTLYDLGDLERAHRLHEEVLAAKRRSLGPEHPDTIAAAGIFATTMGEGIHNPLSDDDMQSVMGHGALISPPPVSRTTSIPATPRVRATERAGAKKAPSVAGRTPRTPPRTSLTAHRTSLTAPRTSLTAPRTSLTTPSNTNTKPTTTTSVVPATTASMTTPTSRLMTAASTSSMVSRTRSVDSRTLTHITKPQDTARKPDAMAATKLLSPQQQQPRPRTVTTVTTSASTVRDQEDLSEARKLQEDMLSARRRVLGAEHPRTLTAMHNLASTLRDQGELERAHKLQQEVLMVRRKTLGAENPDTIATMGTLAVTLKRQGDIEAARKLEEEVLVVRRKVSGQIHPDTLTAMNNLAMTLYDQGDLAKAQRYQEEVWAARMRVLGPEHPDTLSTMGALANTFYDQGELAAAKQLEEQVLDARRNISGAEHPRTLTAMNNLAITLRDLGELAAARKLQEEVLGARRRVLYPDHPDTITAMNNLASTLRDEGDLEGAHRLLEEVQVARRRVSGPEHPDTLTAMNNLAIALRDQGELEGARKLQLEVLATRKKVLGGDHADTLTAMHNLASILHDQGDLRGARKLQEEVLAARKLVLRPEHPDTLTTMGTLATTLYDLRELAAAKQLEEEVLGARRRVSGPEHPRTLTAMNNLAMTLRDQGDLVGARQLQEEVLEARRKVLGPDHPDTLTAMNNLASTLRDQGELDAAHRLLEDVLAARQRVWGPEHPDTLSAMNSLAITLRDQGELQGARRVKEQVLATRKRVLGPQHPETLTTMDHLAATLRAQGELDAACKMQQEVVVGRKVVLGDDHPDTMGAMHSLASTLRAQGELEGARKLQEEAVEARRKVLGPQHPDTLTTMNNLAATLRDQGELEQAKTLQQQVVEARVSVLGPEHVDTLAAMDSLAGMLQNQGQVEAARKLKEEVLVVRTKTVGREAAEGLANGAAPGGMEEQHEGGIFKRGEGSSQQAKGAKGTGSESEGSGATRALTKILGSFSRTLSGGQDNNQAVDQAVKESGTKVLPGTKVVEIMPELGWNPGHEPWAVGAMSPAAPSEKRVPPVAPPIVVTVQGVDVSKNQRIGSSKQGTPSPPKSKGMRKILCCFVGSE